MAEQQYSTVFAYNMESIAALLQATPLLPIFLSEEVDVGMNASSFGHRKVSTEIAADLLLESI